MIETLQLPTFGAQIGLDRASERRSDKSWVAARLHSPQARFLVLADLKLAVRSNEALTETRINWFTGGDLARLAIPLTTAKLLGQDAGHCYFSVDLRPSELIQEDRLSALKPLVDIRSLAIQGAMSDAELALAGQARALACWHELSRCCGRCGSGTAPRDAGWRRSCTSCGQDVYPRSDPAVIMLVTDGERCLLGHETRFPDRFYSVLAGFIEPGDDIEHAVRREVLEETGVRVGRVGYLASQPWPFPHALMIGCWAEALSTDLTLDPAELEDAFWATRDDVLSMLAGRDAAGRTLPGRMSMANTLLKAFCACHGMDGASFLPPLR